MQYAQGRTWCEARGVHLVSALGATTGITGPAPLLLLTVPGIETLALPMLGRLSTIEIQPSPFHIETRYS